VGLPIIEVTPLARADDLLHIAVPSASRNLSGRPCRPAIAGSRGVHRRQHGSLGGVPCPDGLGCISSAFPPPMGYACKARRCGDAHLGTSGDPSRLSSVGREDLVKEVGQQGYPPVRVGCQHSGH
jgi:hypothetical protein